VEKKCIELATEMACLPTRIGFDLQRWEFHRQISWNQQASLGISMTPKRGTVAVFSTHKETQFITIYGCPKSSKSPG
jgi:hypothetical protein